MVYGAGTIWPGFLWGSALLPKVLVFLPLLMLLPFALLRIFKVENSQTGAPNIVGRWQWCLGPVVMLGAICLWFLPMLLLVEHSQILCLKPIVTTYYLSKPSNDMRTHGTILNRSIIMSAQ